MVSSKFDLRRTMRKSKKQARPKHECRFSDVAAMAPHSPNHLDSFSANNHTSPNPQVQKLEHSIPLSNPTPFLCLLPTTTPRTANTYVCALRMTLNETNTPYHTFDAALHQFPSIFFLLLRGYLLARRMTRVLPTLGIMRRQSG